MVEANPSSEELQLQRKKYEQGLTKMDEMPEEYKTENVDGYEFKPVTEA